MTIFFSLLLIVLIVFNFFTCRKSDGVQKGAINEKRKLSANLTLTKAHLQLKQREGIILLCVNFCSFK